MKRKNLSTPKKKKNEPPIDQAPIAQADHEQERGIFSQEVLKLEGKRRRKAVVRS
jgi:hypothetical protein